MVLVRLTAAAYQIRPQQPLVVTVMVRDADRPALVPPAPGGIVPIQISGGACDIGLHRPAGTGTGVAVAVSGGLCGLRLDHQAFGAIGGSARLTSGAVGDNVPSYCVEVSGGASGLHVAARS